MLFSLKWEGIEIQFPSWSVMEMWSCDEKWGETSRQKKTPRITTTGTKAGESPRHCTPVRLTEHPVLIGQQWHDTLASLYDVTWALHSEACRCY